MDPPYNAVLSLNLQLVTKAFIETAIGAAAAAAGADDLAGAAAAAAAAAGADDLAGAAGAVEAAGGRAGPCGAACPEPADPPAGGGDRGGAVRAQQPQGLAHARGPGVL